jgi:hypothetical protein
MNAEVCSKCGTPVGPRLCPTYPRPRVMKGCFCQWESLARVSYEHWRDAGSDIVTADTDPVTAEQVWRDTVQRLLEDVSTMLGDLVTEQTKVNDAMRNLARHRRESGR